MSIITRSMLDTYRKYIPDSVESYLPLVDPEGAISDYAVSCMEMDLRQMIEGLVHLESVTECETPTLLYLTFSLFISECSKIIPKTHSVSIENYAFDVALTITELFTGAASLADDDVVYVMFYFAIKGTASELLRKFWDMVIGKIEEIYSWNVSSMASIRTLASM